MIGWLRTGLVSATLVLVGVTFGWPYVGEAEAPPAAKGPRQVMLVRHAEKPIDDADIHLTSRGAARAAALPSLFHIPPMFSTKPAALTTPDFLFAAKASKRSNRSIETLTPLAKALDKPLNDKHANADFAVVVEHIFGDAKYVGKTVLIGWHHGTIAELTAAITAKAKNGRTLKVPHHWEAAVFDRVWIITFDDSRNATFADRPQKLLFGDSTK